MSETHPVEVREEKERVAAGADARAVVPPEAVDEHAGAGDLAVV